MKTLLPTILNILPPAASNWAKDVDFLFWFVTTICTISFILVEGALIYFAIRYRRRQGEKDKKTPFHTHSTKLEFIWTLLPTVVVMVIFFYSLVVWLDMREKPSSKEVVQIDVKGQKWFWSFYYPNSPHSGDIKKPKGAIPMGSTQPSCKPGSTSGNATKDKAMATLNPTDCQKLSGTWQEGDHMAVPIGKKVVLWMTSADVLHSFYVPAFRIKQDVVPGLKTFLWFIPTKLGTFNIFCTEYCGKNHSGMIGKIEVLSAADFKKYLHSKTKVPDEGAAVKTIAQRIEEGQGLFASKGCVACHKLDGSRLVGPALNGLYGKKEPLEGGKSVLVDDNYLKESMLDPAAKVVKSYPAIMPAMELSDDELSSLIEFMKSKK